MPSRMTTSPLPWDSPAVRKRSIVTSFYTNFLRHPAPAPGDCAGRNRPRPCIVTCALMLKPTLFADRFLWRSGTRAIDLATGECVILRVSAAGTRQEQIAWTERCARALRPPSDAEGNGL